MHSFNFSLKFNCSYFTKLWNERVNEEPTPDLISMMIHSEHMKDMDHMEFMGNLVLLIVGGNDTTRNTMSGVAWGLHQFPEERAKLQQNPDLIPNAVQEIIRWQTPVLHMRRLANRDIELGNLLRCSFNGSLVSKGAANISCMLCGCSQ